MSSFWAKTIRRMGRQYIDGIPSSKKRYVPPKVKWGVRGEHPHTVIVERTLEGMLERKDTDVFDYGVCLCPNPLIKVYDSGFPGSKVIRYCANCGNDL